MVDPPILSARNITKRFGEFMAVDNVTLELSRGRSLCIIGPNGAGKTTFINLVSGFFYPDEGCVMFEGADITHLSPAKRVKAGIARTFQLVHVFDNLTVADNLGLSFFRKKENSAFPLRMFCSSLTSPSISQRVADSLEIFGLHHQKDEITRNLPLGSKKRLEIAMALIADPEILIFDEPFAGLGDQEIDELVEVFKKHTAGKTLLVVEHKISKLEAFVDQLAVMHEGRLVHCGGYDETLNHPDVKKCYWKIDH
jgi:branched-chain amino acid transport system ATP-binding protein